MPRGLTIATLSLCLLVLQVQVWAATALGCQRAAGLDGRASEVCQQHLAHHSNPAPDRPALLDCQKCTLHCMVTVAAPAQPAPLLSEQRGRQTQVAGAALHFYQFVPKIPERPPRV